MSAAPEQAPLSDSAIVSQLAGAREKRLVEAWGAGWAPGNPNASDLHDCRRYMVHRQIAWRVRPTPEMWGLGVIEHGSDMEPVMIAQLRKEGEASGKFEIVGDQQRVELFDKVDGKRTLVLSGNMDFGVRWGGHRGEIIPTDTKSTSEWVLKACDTEEDLKTHSLWTRKWWRQLQAYLLGYEKPRGLIYLGNRGERKAVVVNLDYDEGERILQLARWTVQTVRDFIGRGVNEENVDEALTKLGEDYHHEWSVCKSCPFKDRSCFPPNPGERTGLQVRPDLADDVATYLELKGTSTAFSKAQKKLKEETEGCEQTIVGDLVLKGQMKIRNSKAQPAKDAKVSEYWSFKVEEGGGQ